MWLGLKQGIWFCKESGRGATGICLAPGGPYHLALFLQVFCRKDFLWDNGGGIAAELTEKVAVYLALSLCV